MENFSLLNLIESVIPMDWVSGVFVVSLVLITLFFVRRTLHDYSRSKQHVSFCMELLSDLKQEDLAKRRSEIRNKAKENPELGNVWEEFDESLVLHKAANGQHRLSNTLDAAHFFNAHTLAEDLTENRMLAAVPGFLVAIGVVGTFLGLQLGLSGVDLGGGEVSEVKEGIYGMLKGASVAFQSSLWGIFLSVAFNFFEKRIERKVIDNISEVQNRIDFLYPRISPEQMLVEIAAAGKEGTETMQGLAEQIGNRMQEAVTQSGEVFGNILKDNLHEILSPALEKIASDAKTGSEKALESMVERFIGSFGRAGEEQRNMMDRSSTEIRQAIGSFGESMNQFLGSLDRYARETEEKNLARNEQLGSLIMDYETRNEERQAKISSAIESLMKEVNEGVKEQMDMQRRFDQEHRDAILQRTDEMRSSQEDLSRQLQTMLSRQDESHGELHEKMSVLFESFERVSGTNRSAAENFRESSEKMLQVFSMLSDMSAEISGASGSISGAVERLERSTAEMVRLNGEAARKQEGVVELYGKLAGEIHKASEVLNNAAQHAERGFDSVEKNLAGFQEKMSAHVEDMRAQMNEMMKNFAESVRVQTTERLREWNSQTAEYTQTMTNAIEAIADVVEEIETKAERDNR